MSNLKDDAINLLNDLNQSGNFKYGDYSVLFDAI